MHMLTSVARVLAGRVQWPECTRVRWREGRSYNARFCLCLTQLAVAARTILFIRGRGGKGGGERHLTERGGPGNHAVEETLCDLFPLEVRWSSHRRRTAHVPAFVGTRDYNTHTWTRAQVPGVVQVCRLLSLFSCSSSAFVFSFAFCFFFFSSFSGP